MVGCSWISSGMIQCIVKIVESIESLFVWICNRITWLTLAVVNPGHRWEEVKEKRLFPICETGQKSNGLQLDLADGESAENAYSEEKERQKYLDEKNKILLTVSALFIAGTSMASRLIDEGIIRILPLVPSLLAIYLVLVHFQVGSHAVVCWKTVASKPKAKRGSEKAHQLWQCADSLNEQNNFRVGVYRGAVRLLLTSLFLLVPLILLVAADKPESENSTKAPEIVTDRRVPLTEHKMEAESPEAGHVENNTALPQVVVEGSDVPMERNGGQPQQDSDIQQDKSQRSEESAEHIGE